MKVDWRKCLRNIKKYYWLSIWFLIDKFDDVWGYFIDIETFFSIAYAIVIKKCF